MNTLPWPGPLVASETLGRYFTMSSNDETLSWLRVSALRAWIVMGTFWMLSERRCAVTTMSAISRLVAFSSAGAANAVVPCALSTAMTANDSL